MENPIIGFCVCNDACYTSEIIQEKIKYSLKNGDITDVIDKMDIYYSLIKKKQLPQIEENEIIKLQTQLNSKIVQKYGYNLKYDYINSYMFYYDYNNKLLSIITDWDSILNGRLNVKKLLRSEHKKCRWCLQITVSKRRKKKCARCQIAYYCSRSHQKKDWNKKHKLQCLI